MRYPGAEWKPLSTNYQTGGCTPHYLILHIMEGTLPASDSWFRNPQAQVSAHFGVGKDGAVIQWVDTADTAWHAANANGVAIGVEHEGNAGDSLTAAQVVADAKLLAWASEHHPIPLQVTNDPQHGSGLAYHGLGGGAWGGHLQCPGSPIVAQRPDLITRAKAIRAGGTPVTVQEHTTGGKLSLAGLAEQYKTAPSTILRLTADHFPDRYPQPVADYINGVFRGTIKVTDPMAPGLVLYLPA